MNKTRYYVGLNRFGRHVFTSETMPTEESHGARYNCTIGPFRTRRAAYYMATHGENNPHLQTVADAERLSKTVNK